MPWLKLFWFLVLAVWLPGASAAVSCPQPPPKPTKEQLGAGQQAAKDRGFLWRLSKGGHTSYLYGTTHVNKFEWVFPGPLTIQALHQSDSVALELDFSNNDLMRRASQGTVVSYSTELPESLANRVRKLAIATCVSQEALSRQAPSRQLDMLSRAAMRQAGLHPEFGADLVLIEFAQSTKKPIESLETAEISLAADRPEPSRAAFLANLSDALTRLEEGTSQAKTLKSLQAWSNSDGSTFASFPDWCNCMRNDAEKAKYDQTIYGRNPAMAASLDALHRKGRRVFAGVGTLHVFGPQAMPGLMAQRGYKVERVF
jgi:uncharacterized protein